MRESELLAHIYARSRGLGRDVPVGPGDDCAVVITDSGDRLLLTVDQLVAGRHFPPGTPVDLIARKAVARSVSDIAAMAGRPAWALATGLIPDGYAGADELFDAMARWAGHWGCPLVGGDIAFGPGPLALTVTVLGRPHAQRGPVLRSGALPGDGVFVTGRLGGSLASGRHLSFAPRVEEAAGLADALGPALGAMIDLSDGLGIDAGRIAAASGVRIELERGRIPLNGGVRDVAAALGDGEDYELCFTARAGAGVPAACPATGTPIARIGRAAAGSGCVLVDPDGSARDVGSPGWDHGG